MIKKFTAFAPYIVFSFLMFGLVCLDYTAFKDDILFYTLSQKNTLFDFLVWRYFSWSSRSVIEALLFVIIPYSASFRVFYITFFYLLWALSLKYLLKPKTFLQNVLICFMLASFPFCFIKNTGWVATSTNYLFPLIFGLISFKSLYMPKPRALESFFILLATFIASGMEQLCTIMIIVFGAFGFCYLLKYRKIMWFYVLQLELCLFNIVVFALCPGNAFRFGRELRSRMSDMAQWCIFTRLYKGLSHTMDFFFDSPFCLLLIAFNIILFNLLAYNKKTKNLCFSTLFFSGVTLFLIYFWHDNMHIHFIIDNKLGWYYLLFASLLCCLLISLLLLYKNTTFFYVNVLFVFVGLLSSVILGLSPTLYASSLRIFFYFLFILSVLPILAFFNNYNNVSKDKFLFILFFFLSFYTYYLVQNIQFQH